MDMLTVLGRQIHAAQQLVRVRAARNPNELIEAEATFGERIADAVAALRRLVDLHHHVPRHPDVSTPASTSRCAARRGIRIPFILLNLFLSMLAALQAPVIMMSQNRQDTKDRLRGELDFDVNRRAATDIQGLARKLNLLVEKMDDLEGAIQAVGERPGRS